MHAHDRVYIVRLLIAEASFYLAPVGLEFLRANHSERCLDTLPHVHSVAQHCRRAVFGDSHKCGGLLGRLLSRRYKHVIGVLRCERGGDWHQCNAHRATHHHGDEATTRQRIHPVSVDNEEIFFDHHGRLLTR